jgi:ATP-dependent DNA ligase
MNQLIEQLRATRSSNDKKAILSKVTNENIKKAFQLCYDPFINSYVKKIPKIETYGYLTFDESFLSFENLYKRLALREVTGRAALDEVKSVLQSTTKEIADLYELILQKDLKSGVNVSTLNKVFGDGFITEFNVQLANSYNPDKDYGVSHWWVSPKLDGLRCFYSYEHDELFTRGGNPIIGLEEIKNECREICVQWNLKFLDGELFSKDLKFQVIQSIVMSNKNFSSKDKSKIDYVLFTTGGEWKDTEEMVNNLIEVKNTRTSDSKIICIDYTKIENDFVVINALTKKLTDENYEGTMLRDPINWYSWDRDDNLLKHKLFIECDFTVIGFNNGKAGTKYENTLGTILVEGLADWKDDKYEIISLVPGFKEDMRDEIWNNQEFYLGKTVEVGYQNVTDKPDEKTGKYSLRFPHFNKFKLDR